MSILLQMLLYVAVFWGVAAAVTSPVDSDIRSFGFWFKFISYFPLYFSVNTVTV